MKNQNSPKVVIGFNRPLAAALAPFAPPAPLKIIINPRKPAPVSPEMVEVSEAWKLEFAESQLAKAEYIRAKLDANTVTLSIAKCRRGKVRTLSTLLFPDLEVEKCAKSGAMIAKVVQVQPIKKAA